MKITLQRQDNAFSMRAVNTNGHFLYLDGSKSIGAAELAFRPMEALLASLAGCSSIDVLSILYKQKQEVEDFWVEVIAERANEVPAVFTDILLEFNAKGVIDSQKFEKAISLSMEKYCSVTKMLEASVSIRTSFKLH